MLEAGSAASFGPGSFGFAQDSPASYHFSVFTKTPHARENGFLGMGRFYSSGMILCFFFFRAGLIRPGDAASGRMGLLVASTTGLAFR